MGTTQRMARFITEAKFEDIPTPAVNLAKLCLLDAVGCAIYGTTRPLGKSIARSSALRKCSVAPALRSTAISLDASLRYSSAKAWSVGPCSFQNVSNAASVSTRVGSASRRVSAIQRSNR